MDFLSRKNDKIKIYNKEFVYDYSNGYRIQKVYKANINGDIFDTINRVITKHLNSKILIGYIVYDVKQNGCPNS